MSRDGGRTYPARHARPLPSDPPCQPCTVPVFDPGPGTGCMLALDLDPSRGRGSGDRASQVSAQADAIARLVARLGGRCLADISPAGGHHVFVLFAAALPWRELRDLVRALSFRFPVVDPAPMSSLGGQIARFVPLLRRPRPANATRGSVLPPGCVRQETPGDRLDIDMPRRF
ncbi:MAG: hypothetical protein ACRDOH_33760 [Streptosporangiaceae bacterium]